MNLEQIRNKYFPVTLPNGCTVVTSSEKEVYDILNVKKSVVFGRDKEFIGFQVPPERKEVFSNLVRLYKNLHHEWFLFKNNENEPIGWFMGEADDFATFYMRNTGIIPEFQNQGMYSHFLDHLIKYLAEIGYERISSQHKVTNQKILILKLKMGFIITSLEFTESWGPLVKLVKILPKDRRDFFIQIYGDQIHKSFFNE